uniref:Uncharacterized protein n=2 Tax=Guillardia theta TaxID=55529 RepID=A0A6U5XXC6_GUITH|mmetsp:Transcript_19817/g.66023  ORF Transcript_19817/g.66023 Transcript_19817/m.66023 type:complete len:263 (+) Transcript_19817:317-1105(+)
MVSMANSSDQGHCVMQIGVAFMNIDSCFLQGVDTFLLSAYQDMTRTKHILLALAALSNYASATPFGGSSGMLNELVRSSSQNLRELSQRERSCSRQPFQVVSSPSTPSIGGLKAAAAPVAIIPDIARDSSNTFRRQKSTPVYRVRSFGELSSMEYQDLIVKLWDAVEQGDVEETISLVKQVNGNSVLGLSADSSPHQGAWPNHIRTGDGLQANALQLAAKNNHVELIDVLVHLGADVHMANAQGMTALHMAAQLGNMEVTFW